MSRLIQACGLKHLFGIGDLAGVTVAPYTGVWIETLMTDVVGLRSLGRALYRRVD